MSNENKPLTAGIPAIEKIFNVHGIENIDELTAPGTMALLKEAAQQTAEKDARIKELEEVVSQRDEAVKLLVDFKQKIGLPPAAISAIDHITNQYKKDGKCYSSSGNCVNSNVCQGLDHCMYHSGIPSLQTTGQDVKNKH